MTAAAATPGAFDGRRKHMLEILSDQATLAISRTLQAETVKAQARELRALLDVASALTSTLEPDQVFEHVVEGIRSVIHCEDAIIYSYDDGANALQMVTGLGARLDRLGGARIPLRDSRSIAAWVANNRRPRLFAPGTGAVGTVTEMFLGGDKLSLMCAPLISKDRLQGVIMFGRQEAFQPADLTTVVNLSNIIAATLENVSLYQNARAEREPRPPSTLPPPTPSPSWMSGRRSSRSTTPSRRSSAAHRLNYWGGQATRCWLSARRLPVCSVILRGRWHRRSKMAPRFRTWSAPSTRRKAVARWKVACASSGYAISTLA
jgi:GAF domain-containing protein